MERTEHRMTLDPWMFQRTEPYQPLPTGQAGFLCPSGGEVSKGQPRLADVLESQQQAPSHSLVPCETQQQQLCPLEERLERLEADVTYLRKQVLSGQGWGRVGFVYGRGRGA